MSVRVISGSLKGRIIPTVPGEATRPTTDAWRTTIFSAIQQYVSFENSNVLDLFAGSGSLGIECLSRGTRHCTFVDNNSTVIKALTTTLASLNLTNATTVVRSSIKNGTPLPTGTFDVIMADPPYALRCCTQILAALETQNLVVDGSIVVFEHGTGELVQETATWSKIWFKEKGSTIVEMFRYAG